MSAWKEENLLRRVREEKENFSDIDELYAVIRIGGSIGENPYSVIKDNLEHDEAIKMAKRYRKMLSPGEKEYYRIKYKTIPMSKIDSSLCYRH